MAQPMGNMVMVASDGVQLPVGQKMIKKGRKSPSGKCVASGNCGHNGGWGWSQMEDLSGGNQSGWSASPELTHRSRKMPKNMAATVEINDQNVVPGSASGDVGYGSIVRREDVKMVPIQWPNEGQRLPDDDQSGSGARGRKLQNCGEKPGK